LIEAEGWTIKKGKKHYKYVHPVIKGFISVARHKSQEVPDGTLAKMMKIARMKK
jgi:predicted RNA binding protein YcfA (HicA-like mRNA interferase family)